jgi:hypothetical protein
MDYLICAVSRDAWADVTLVVRPRKVVQHCEATLEGHDLVKVCWARMVVLWGPSESSAAGMSCMCHVACAARVQEKQTTLRPLQLA